MEFKELKTEKPELLLSKQLYVPEEVGSDYKLLFATDTDLLMKTAVIMEFNRKCIQEIQGHMCIKVYKNVWEDSRLTVMEEKELNTIILMLDEKYDEQERSKTSEGIPN